MGIDYQKAPIEVREQFALTSTAAVQAMREISKKANVEGCVLLCTCNRTELWTSGRPENTPYEMFCDIMHADDKAYAQYFTQREGEDAVEHLFQLACGMKSQVYGEDQIVTQVKNALSLAQESRCAGKVLDHLFRSAVTAAKRVKTSARLTAADQSVAVSMASFLQQRIGDLSGLACMVVGSGEMGRLAASALAAAGCNTVMTVRQYHHGDVIVPPGVQAMDYEDRYTRIGEMQVVVSATTSPHFTLKSALVTPPQNPVIFCDLAVPRDIDPEIAGISNCTVYDTDEICGQHAFKTIDEQGLRLADAILSEEMDEFYSWYEFRLLVPEVQEISGLAAQDLTGRVGWQIERYCGKNQDSNVLIERVREAAQKSVGRMLFGLRENLDPALWGSCMSALRKSVEKEIHV